MRLIIYIFSTTLLFIAVIFLLLSYVSPNTPSHFFDSTSTSSSVLYFNPKTLSYDPEKNDYSTTIFLNTHSSSVSSAQIELSYNPDIFYDVLITPAPLNLFGGKSDYVVNLTDVRQEYGRASLAIELQNNQREVTGNGPLAVLTFKAVQSTGSATITFLNKSAVFRRLNRKSLLGTALPFTFQLYPYAQ